MQEQPAPVIDGDLARQLERDDSKIIAVQVTFRERPAAEELARLGLDPSFSGSSSIASGFLAPSSIRQLAARTDVVRIAKATVEPGRTEKSGSVDKIDDGLRREMERKPDVSYSVLVSFVKPLEDEAVEALGLMPGKSTEAIGQLTKDAVLAMAKRREVRRIRLSPVVKPM
jgi:hypothetical protein